jgi:hypothetical protein
MVGQSGAGGAYQSQVDYYSNPTKKNKKNNSSNNNNNNNNNNKVKTKPLIFTHCLQKKSFYC